MPTKTTPKDFFLHLGAMASLYASVIALITLSFTVINRAFPDKLASYFSVGSMVWPISVLIVLVPLLYVFEWLVSRDFKLFPEKRELPIRKWRIYLTMFLTGASIAVSLISLIYTYLSGEITQRFIFKVLAVIVISAIVFIYYILAKSDSAEKERARKPLAILGVILVLACIVAGFVVIGSPSTLRAYRFDNQRINDLSQIQNQVLEYAKTERKLPASFADLKGKTYLYAGYSTKDPETGAAYKFSVLSPKRFELCATFGRSSDKNPYRAYYYDSDLAGYWAHGKGETCFEKDADFPNVGN